MSQKFYKLVKKQAVECKTRGEFNAWVQDFDHRKAVVGATEIEGMVIVTAFRPFVTEKSINRDSENCPFNSRLFLGGINEFNVDMPITFPGLTDEGKFPDLSGKHRVAEYNSPSWEEADFIHRTLVRRMTRMFVEAGDIAAGILARIAINSKANNSDQ